MAPTFQAPESLRGYITDDEWSARLERAPKFDTLPMRDRLEFIEKFAKEFDWTDVCFGSLLETADQEEVARVFRGAVMRHIEGARELMNAGGCDDGRAHAALLGIMRASALGKTADAGETEFGRLHPNRRCSPMTLLGDIIAWEWSRAFPAAEHDRLCKVVRKLTDNGMTPDVVKRTLFGVA